MIEVGNNPDSLGGVIVHSTESGQFLGCTRIEFERLAAAIMRGEFDAFLGMQDRSAVADGAPDWTVAARPAESPDPAEQIRQAGEQIGAIRRAATRHLGDH